MNEWAGLRPGRPQVRLERDHIRDKYGNTLEVCIRKDALVRHKSPSCIIISSLSFASSTTYSGEFERQQALLVLPIISSLKMLPYRIS